VAAGKRKHFYGATRHQVQQKLTAALRDQQQGLPIVSEQITVAQFLAHWLENTARNRVRESTFGSYQLLINRHTLPHIGRRRLARLTPEDLERLYCEKAREGLSAQTITNLHRVLHTALSQAVGRNQIARNPCDLVTPHVLRLLDVREAFCGAPH
jgi:integrase